MQIVDAQIHVWGGGLPSNLAHRQVTAFPTEEAVGLMDGACRRRGHPSAGLGPRRDRDGVRGGAHLIRPVRDHGGVAAGPAGEPRAGGDLEEPAGHARSALRVPAGAAAAGWRMARSTGSGPLPSVLASRLRC